MNSRTINTGITRIKFQNSHTVYENFIKCTIKDYEFNLSYNPTLLSGSQATLTPYSASVGGDVFYNPTGSEYFGILKPFTTGSEFSPYASEVGLYNDAGDLLAVAKLASPMPLSPNTDMTFLVKFDTQWINRPYFTPTPSPSMTPPPSVVPASPSVTPTVTPTISLTPSSTPSISVTPSNTPSINVSPSATPSISITPSISLTPSISMTPSVTVTPSSTLPSYYEYTLYSNTGYSMPGTACINQPTDLGQTVYAAEGSINFVTRFYVDSNLITPVMGGDQWWAFKDLINNIYRAQIANGGFLSNSGPC